MTQRAHQRAPQKESGLDRIRSIQKIFSHAVLAMTLTVTVNPYGSPLAQAADSNALATRAYGDSPTQEEFQAFISAFNSTPKAFIDFKPPKRSGNLLVESSLFSAEEVASEEFLKIKDDFRTGRAFEAISDYGHHKGICGPEGCVGDEIAPGKRKALNNVSLFFDPEELPPTRQVIHLDQMETMGLMSHNLESEPWSDDYWPIYRGILGARYVDSDFTNLPTDFMKFKEFVLDPVNTFFALFQKSDGRRDRHELSPSEKYDLLVGYHPQSQSEEIGGWLTPSMWAQGQAYYDRFKKVETWMGICHGWAPASYMVKTPAKAIDLALDDGSSLTLYPSDIKGLASYLWSNTGYDSTFLGGRCYEKSTDLERDPESGAIVNESCFDVNPKNWHIAMVNQLGIAKRSFVLDVTYDQEVWNQPVRAYSYTYFNPSTGRLAQSLAEAAVRSDDPWRTERDPFRNIRGRNEGGTPDKIVGVRMDVTYMVETSPSHREHQRNDSHTVTYIYDLEINEVDGHNVIVGGEWYSNKHPDFIWSARTNARPAIDLELHVSAGAGLNRFTKYNPSLTLSANITNQDVIPNSGRVSKGNYLNFLQKFAQWGMVSGWIVEGLVDASAEPRQ